MEGNVNLTFYILLLKSLFPLLVGHSCGHSEVMPMWHTMVYAVGGSPGFSDSSLWV